MTKTQLLTNCGAENIDYAAGEHDGESGVFLHWNNPNNPSDGECCFINNAAIEQQDWPTIRRMVVNGRDVTGYTRIIGYFSSVKNWNKSKVGELKDRRAGNYKV